MMNKRSAFYAVGLIIVIAIILKFALNKMLLAEDKIKESKKPTLIVRHFNNGGFDKLIMLNEILSDQYEVIVDNNSETYDIALIGTFGEEEVNNANAFKIFITGEAITPDISKYDLSIGYNPIDNDNYFRIPYNLIDV